MGKILAFFTLFILYSSSLFSEVHVEGYYRKNGTYVQPHFRSEPNHRLQDNWSTKGNLNPRTGQPGVRNY